MQSIIKIAKVCELTSCSRSTIDRLEKAGEFPQRVRLSHASVGWYLAEILQWIESRPRGFIDPELTAAATEASVKARELTRDKRTTRPRKRQPASTATA